MIKLQLNENAANEHFEIVKPLIQGRINGILKKGIKKNSKSIALDTSLVDYLDFIKDDNNLRELILVTPDKLKKLINEIKISNPLFIIPSANSNLVLRNIFIDHCYNNKLFDKLNFISKIGLDTCPYCNRNYIYYLSKAKKIKPQIDHFYPKSKYPFLGASFYNLIPSCQTCNGFGAKEENDPISKNLTHPYLVDPLNFKFSYEIDSINFLNPLVDKKSISIKFINKLPGHLDIFKLDKLYEQHTDHVLELILKGKIKYSKQYRRYLEKNYESLKLDENFINRMILGNYSTEEEIHRRPLAKLYQDIGKELGLIN